MLRSSHIACQLVLAVAARADEGAEFFEKRIRPVLAEQCYECHGEKKQKAGLRLDSRAGWEKGGDSGAIIERAKPEHSLLIKSLRHTDPDLKMPRNAPKLAENVIADFVAWIKMGTPDSARQPVAAARAWPETFAERRKWWCFQPIANPAPPPVRDALWSSHPIDRFILAKLEAKGITPAGDADTQTLARRLSFALTGLPPTPVEIQSSEFKIQNYADTLLASPAFGEKWARHWLDLARYAETFGSEHDYLNPHAWRYRDYVIRAFNDDLPYDQFVREQLAGDLIAPRWRDGLNEAKLGVAWHRLIESYASPVDVKREEVSVVDWQLEAFGKTFLGLTITCARCHDHKFDPISAADFHALYGVFASARPTLSILDDPAKLTARDAELAKLKGEIRTALAERWEKDVTPAALDAALKRDGKGSLAPLRELSKSGDFPKAWSDLRARQTRPQKPDGTPFADLTRDLGGWSVSGPGLPASPSPAGLLSLATGDRFVRAIQPAGYFSDAISERHGGHLRSPDFIIERRKVSVLASGSGKARLRLVIENFQNDLLLFTGVNPDLDSPAPRWVTMEIKDQWLGRRARVELLTRDDKTCVGEVKDSRAWEKTDGRSAFGIVRVVLHDGEKPPSPTPFPAALWNLEPKNAEELAAGLEKLTHTTLASWKGGLATDDDARLLHALLEAGVLTNKGSEFATLTKKFGDAENAIPLPTRAPGVCNDGGGHDCEQFPRGDHTKPGAPVPRRFPEVLGGAKLDGASGRLALANELTRRENPLAARVMVNRVWQHLFGRGLVATPDNFGRMGDLPTHPELLDHLATKFIDDGWSVKKLIRYIVTSRTWRLAADPPPRADELDPNNDLLSHARARRLEAEAIRDAMLAVAGNLKPGYDGGPGAQPFYRVAIEPDRQPRPGALDGGGRRSVYLEVRRLFPSEFLGAFDAPKPNVFTGRRSETNVPAQSLALLNDPFVQHQAKLFAKRVAAISGDEARISQLYQLALSRPPENGETQRALAFLRDAGVDGWRDLAHAIFNMKEFIYVR